MTVLFSATGDGPVVGGGCAGGERVRGRDFRTSQGRLQCQRPGRRQKGAGLPLFIAFPMSRD